MKCRWDVLPDPGEGLPDTEHCFADLKFVEVPNLRAFTRISAGYDRHCQAAVYSRGYHDLREAWPVVAYVIVGQRKPHPIICCTMSERFLEIGFETIDDDLAGLASCRKSGLWYSEEELEEAIIPDIEPPYWLDKQHEERMR